VSEVVTVPTGVAQVTPYWAVAREHGTKWHLILGVYDKAPFVLHSACGRSMGRFSAKPTGLQPPDVYPGQICARCVRHSKRVLEASRE
jgi:hypothetical protein